MNHLEFSQEGFQKAKDIVTAINVLGGKARLGETYMDYGAGITWETIMIHSQSLDMEYQGLHPRDFKEMNNGDISHERIQDIVLTAIGKSKNY